MCPRGVAQPGSAHRLGRWSRRFKSCRPDLYLAPALACNQVGTGARSCMRHSRSKIEQARYLRETHGFSLDKLAAELSIPRTTIYYWVKSMPVQKTTAKPVQRSEKQK